MKCEIVSLRSANKNIPPITQNALPANPVIINSNDPASSSIMFLCPFVCHVLYNDISSCLV